MTIKAALWSQNGGGCLKATIGGVDVKFIAAGRGDYARCQGAPEGYSDAELEGFAAEIVDRLLAADPTTPAIYGPVGPGDIINCVLTGGFVRDGGHDYFGNPTYDWVRQTPLRGMVEVELPEKEMP